VVNIDLVDGSTGLDQMNTGNIDNTDKDSYVILFDDESLVSLDNHSISVENDSHLISEDSLMVCVYCVAMFSLLYFNEYSYVIQIP
jgi:hypothetical protein